MTLTPTCTISIAKSVLTCHTFVISACNTSIVNTLYVVYIMHGQRVDVLFLDSDQVVKESGCDQAAVDCGLVPVFCETSVVICKQT